MHIFHDWKLSMTYEEVIHTCRVCGKEKREPWYPIMGLCRPPRIPKRAPEVKEPKSDIKISYINLPKEDSTDTKPCMHKYVLLGTMHSNKVYDLFYCERCLNYEKRESPR